MALKGLIRSYNDVSGAGVVFVFAHEATLNFDDGGGSGFVAGSRVTLTMTKAPNTMTAAATVSNVQAE